MKKRIGSKIYDTETSELIADVGIGILYRKCTQKREWFLLIGDHIEPVDDKQARALLGINYKNNYQRKQAVWREKWMKKVEERQKQKALINFSKAAYEAGESLREAFVNLCSSILDMADLMRTTINDIYETLSKPEVIEELKKLQGESKNT